MTEKVLENFKKQEGNNSRYNLETIQGLSGNEVSFSTERGGIIKSLKLNGKEVLYLDEDNFEGEGNVRGGIPILFPNAGALEGENNPYPELKQHGFARISNKWEVEKTGDRKFSEKLSSDEETKKIFPFNLETRIKGELLEDGSVTLFQEVTNLEVDKDVPVAMGLHPYFKVQSGDKKNIKFIFSQGETIEADFSNWSEGGTTRVDNPKVKDREAVLKIEIPGLGILIMDVSPEYQKIWIWSEPGKDFICIEPMMRMQNGLIDNPEMLKPGNNIVASVNLRLV